MFKADPVFKATPESVGSLIESIHRGAIALPDFQRSFVWDPKRTVELLKSIISRYPAGTLLTWEQSDDVRFGSRSFEGAPAPKQDPKRLVLDGQQRLTALYQALTGTGEYHFFMKVWPFIDRQTGSLLSPEDVDLDSALIAYDLTGRRRFDPLDEDWQISNGIFPISSYGRIRPWFKKLARSVEVDGQRADDLEEVLNQFRDTYLQPLESYSFPVVDLPASTSLVAVCNIFETLNKSGKVLGPFELLTAKYYPTGVHLRDLWDAACQQYPLLVEFGVDPYSVLQAISLRSRGSAQRFDVLNRLEPSSIREHWDMTVAAFADMLDMLKRECGVILPQWLPYSMVVVPMAAVYPEVVQLRSHYRAAARERLRQYYWCTVFTENFDQGANSQAGADYKLLRGWVVGNSQDAPEAVSEFNLTDYDLLGARANKKALFRGFVTLLIQSGAKDFLTAQAITSLDHKAFILDGARVFPRTWLNILGNNPEGHSSELILNRIMIDKSLRVTIKDRPFGEHVAAQAEFDRRKYSDVLRSHLIDDGDESGLELSDYNRFLQERLTLLVELIEEVTGQSLIYESEG
ncbi:DUF262 domain-containing protein [Streptomyces albidoflavus]|uniref:GmrSD restriction endonuclease domain-containing protein n=1 Tax=Streptomyces albidoflavus TaxID=1886 RepID=UPI0021D5A84F|nr:DUF262 domain-containing protein [Streptomyces albidoflavus]MCU7705017.1 DUF262 domain-containing protein [Streptomyces albidoflavus]